MDFDRYQKLQINAELDWKTRRTVLLLLLTMLTLPITIVVVSLSLSDFIGRESRIKQNEKIAIQSLQEIISAQIRYHRQSREFGNFDQLQAMGWIDKSFHGAVPSRSGYFFMMTVTPGYDTGFPAFDLVAEPANIDTGVRHFFVSSRDYVIRSNSAKTATEADAPIAH